MNIDWDAVANDADRSPNAVLAEFMAANLTEVVVIGITVTEDGADAIRYETSGSAFKALGMVEYARLRLQDWVASD